MSQAIGEQAEQKQSPNVGARQSRPASGGAARMEELLARKRTRDEKLLALMLETTQPAGSSGMRAEPEDPPEADPVETVQELLLEIQEGKKKTADLSPRRRQECVGYLTLEGFTIGDIAHVLGICERTVGRDRVEWRRRQIVSITHPDLREYLGEFEAVTHASRLRLMRIARDSKTPPEVRVRAEQAATRLYREWLEMVRKVRASG